MGQGQRVELLERLAKLRSEGAISDAEYAAEKTRLLSVDHATQPKELEQTFVRRWKPKLLAGAALGLLTVSAMWFNFPRGESPPDAEKPTARAPRPNAKIANGRALPVSNTAEADTTETAETNSPDVPDYQPAYLNQCHMGYCSWARRTAVSVIQRSRSERLLQVSFVSGSSKHDGDYPPSYSKSLNIDWDANSSNAYVLCSKARPAVGYANEGTFTLDFLDLFEVYGYQTTAAATYVRTCHSLDYHASVETLLRRLGYRPGTPNEQLRDRANIDELRPI